MSSIVRKLIAASNGIPPSIVDWDELWAALTHEIELWVKDVFADGDAATLKDRWVLSGEMALDQLTNHMVSVSSATSGLCVIAMSDQCARAYAANRLGDDPNAMKSVSSLLLRLVSEEPLSRLRADISSSLNSMQAHTCEALGSNLSLAPGGFAQTASYLIVAYDLSIQGVRTTLKLVFGLDALRSFSQVAQAKPAHDADTSAQGKLRKTVLATNVDVLGVIGRREISLGECIRMEPGDVIELPDISGSDLALAVETFEGCHDLAGAELGAWKTSRALKLKRAIDPSFLTGLVASTAKSSVSVEESRL